ncbi:MAG: hypothetical protein U1F34_08930 [Gammaproteobacteria bacterium]
MGRISSRSMKILHDDFSPPIVAREVMLVMCGAWWVHQDNEGWHPVRSVDEATQFEDFERCMRLASQVQKASEQIVRVIGCSTIEE